jgi:phage terminase large subunit GpA-like protein
MIDLLRSRALGRLMPPPNLLPSEWANRHRKLSPESSAEPGDFDINRTPYMREILDTVKDPAIAAAWFIKSSQVTASENMNNLVGYLVDCDPCPMLFMLPTIELAEDYSKDRLEPMFRDTPRLRDKLDPREKKSGNTIRHKRFPGGLLQLVGANSPSGLQSRPIAKVFADEVDQYPRNSGKQGDPIGLARRRQETFPEKFFFGTGTPTVKGASRIERGFTSGDCREYRVPCPRCDQHFAIEVEHFAKDDPADPHFGQVKCPSCEGWIEEHERFMMIRDAKAGGSAYWHPTKAPDSSEIRSWRIWSIYSPFKSWREIADEWQAAKGDPEAEQVVTNTLFGKSYVFQTAEVDHEALFKQREDYDGQRLPNAVEVITVGVDTQDDRFELEAVGWGLGEESWSIEFATIDGDPADEATRERLDRYLAESVFTREDGKTLTVSAAFIDSGGHRTDDVYSFVRGKQFRHIYACKGSSTVGQPVFARFSAQKKSKIRLAIVGTDTAKEAIYSRLAKGSETRGKMHFPLTYSREYFSGLTSEEKIVTWKSGTPRVEWKKRKGIDKARNEPLDVRVYALAALRSLPMASRKLRSGRTYELKRPARHVAPDVAPDVAPAEQPPAPQAKPAAAVKRAVPARRPQRRAGWWAG